MRSTWRLCLFIGICNFLSFSWASPRAFVPLEKISPTNKPTLSSKHGNKKHETFHRPTSFETALTVRGGIGDNLAFAKKHPFAFQLIIATVKTALADMMTQTVAQGQPLSAVDWKRNAIFVVFGCAYLGGFQYYLMVNKYRQWFPTMDRFAKLTFAEKIKDTDGIIDAIKMVLFDLMIHMPLMYFPVYYTVKEFVGGGTWNPLDWVIHGCQKYRGNVKDDYMAMVKLWGPADCVQFILPLEARMPFRHLVSFFWTAYVSFTRGSIGKK